MKLLFKFNLILLTIFGIGGLVISLVAYNFLADNAQREVLDQAELMMTSAKAVRDYTSSDLSPLLTQVPSHQVHFIAETVPAVGATTTFRKLREHYPQYMYKEATLNPTNLEDRTTDLLRLPADSGGSSASTHLIAGRRRGSYGGTLRPRSRL